MTRKLIGIFVMLLCMMALLAPVHAQEATPDATDDDGGGTVSTPEATSPGPEPTSEATSVATSEATSEATVEATATEEADDGDDAPVATATAEVTPAATEPAAPQFQAPPVPANAIARGLNNPRGIAFGPDGTLYIAEGGVGGDTPVDTPEGPGTMGFTSQIIAVAPDGTQRVVVGSLVSVAGGGVDAVALDTDGHLWATVSGGPPNAPLTASALHIDPMIGRILTYVDLFTNEATNNPDGNEIDSNPVDVEVAADGTVYFVDAGCNCVLRWTEAGGLQTFLVWPDNSVPTSIAIAPDGTIVIGFLSAAPFTPGSAKVETYAADGTLKQIYTGLTMVVGVLANTDGIYAVELSQNATAAQPAPGAIVKVGENGMHTIVVDNLALPYGIAQSPSGQVVVTINSAMLPPGNGAVIPVSLK